MIEQGFDVVRLNFRDHGNTHHLNPGIFHSNLIDEVVHAAGDIAQRWPQLPLVAAGYSLGGNFVLRLALRAPAAGVPLLRVASVCPVLDPGLTMESIENGPAMYDWYFRRKWAGSLRRKRDLFPELSDCDDRVLKLDIRALTAWLVERHTSFGSLQAYFDGYSIAGDRLSALQVPADILMAQDDPVIPYATFSDWQLPRHARLETACWEATAVSWKTGGAMASPNGGWRSACSGCWRAEPAPARGPLQCGFALEPDRHARPDHPSVAPEPGRPGRAAGPGVDP